MLKKIGFIIIIGGLLVFLQPNLFSGLFQSKDLSASLIEEDKLQTRGVSEVESAEYAEGYSAENFGEAFTSPDEGKFVVTQEEQPVGPWVDLLKLKFAVRFDEEVDDVVFEPKFTDKIKAYTGKIIEVEGFIIAHDVVSKAMGDVKDDGQKFMFSAFPMASCFFCGGAGAESVMEISPKKPIPYTDKKVKLKGRLELNDKDLMKLPYLLKDVVLVEENL